MLCCCLPTPVTLASGGSPMFPLVVHQPASPSIWPAVQSLRRNCDDVCMCVVNKQFELFEFVSESVYVDLQYDEISLTFTAGPVCLCGVSSPVVVLGLFVRLS